ncbi:hypothetical protein CAPTEDRAFT_180115 [Capitella teleta]|uniref:Guanylate cyclase n=1 Tax=Capitella teleta TaxID=283909 RepID=N1PBB3_CAPTE|nr:hypothetical protein CAPTEDRAFT_180115 [Capitella teleta]|eukprot:ELU18794.1 hypothetical protein CAPTEDRAFT_180115 [Capitella teleta]
MDHVELKTMREINHENLNGFVGACVDPPNICIVTKYCSKGSLQDILENEDIKLDQNFKTSLISDIIMGMEYLHRSPLKSNGRLKSTNCVVDGRWVLKITDWGLDSLRERTYETDNARYSALMWTSPELLREVVPPPKGTQKGDVYSFAIILQEIIYRYPPYGTPDSLQMVPKDLIGRVRNGETPPFRPVLSGVPGVEVHTPLIQMMKECWAEDANARPDFYSIKMKFNAMNKGKTYNIMDNMLRMMEKYASNLEDIINDRTRQLVEEKKKTDLLLYRMLPSTIADHLKAGTTIKPELFREVSVYFSDIVSFTSMASESSPMEVVDFLNDLWTVFDDTIARYDVYKVETIGDAYMVASGIPLPNGQAHASEISSMALDVLSSVLTFKIRHRPDRQLEVRIGVHSGPVVAGVVGQTMPRYCLFGDTVNTASRMESTGAAQRIHISQDAYYAIKATNKGFIMAKRGLIDIKGKGVQTTYWLEGREGYTRPLPKPSMASDGYND